MSYEFLEKQIRALPEKYLGQVAEYVKFLAHKAEREVALERFDAMCKETQAWAKSVGITEQDITDTIREVRAEKRARALAQP